MLSGYVNKVRCEERNAVYCIAGDMFRGSIIDSEFRGISTIEIMNMLAPDVVLRYSGTAFDPTKTDNSLSLLLAKKATESIVYSFDEEQVLCNRVDAQI